MVFGNGGAGMGLSEAYRANYNTMNMGDQTIWNESSTLRANHEVAIRVADLTEGVTTALVAENVDYRARLGEIALLEPDDPVKYTDVLSAIDKLIKLDGGYAPTEVHHSGQIEHLHGLSRAELVARNDALLARLGPGVVEVVEDGG